LTSPKIVPEIAPEITATTRKDKLSKIIITR
jgi:hypothetical protein